MTIPDEKEPPVPVSPTSLISPSPTDLNLDKPLPELNLHHKLSSPPKRKPLPIAKPVATPNHDVNAQTTDTHTSKSDTRRIPPWLDWTRFSKRKRLVVVIGIVTAIILLALIIGLAVGLTVNKGPQNLPLPTSHGGPYQGDLTYYTPALGACGISSSSSDLVCAVSHVLYDAVSTGTNPNENPLCGLKLRLKRDGRSVDVKVVDRCVGCQKTDIDVSPRVFKELADPVQGRVPVRWSWLEESPVSYEIS